MVVKAILRALVMKGIVYKIYRMNRINGIFLEFGGPVEHYTREFYP